MSGAVNSCLLDPNQHHRGACSNEMCLCHDWRHGDGACDEFKDDGRGFCAECSWTKAMHTKSPAIPGQADGVLKGGEG